ncbi:MAG: hypothetical protein NWF14_05260 [Candidatus Bathyarchaeota archaeon]|nr:hypothetical protein [Candidatus Bathyarchaeota archaeon]
MGNKRARNSELASLTVSMFLSIVFFTAVFWAFPFIPMLIVLMYDLPFTVFITLWLFGLPFTAAAFYYIFKAKK